jgi:hypothetical protein
MNFCTNNMLLDFIGIIEIGNKTIQMRREILADIK